jgi:predicted glycogen debranching enzyme
MTTITFGRQTCGTLQESATREWLVTDGLGGYAMGTVAGLRTRRYHGLLVVAMAPPIGRHLGLAALDAVLVLGDRRVHLATHEWAGGAISPSGYELLERFDLIDGVPRWRWSAGSVVVEAEVAMAHGRPAVGVTWTLRGAGADSVTLEVDALCTWRDVHGERRAAGEPGVERVTDGFVFEDAYSVRGPGFEPAGSWYLGVHHREEAARGLTADEDLWHAGRFRTELRPGSTCEIEAWAGDLATPPPPAGELVFAARARARAVAVTAGATDEVDALLAHAADQFVVTGSAGPTVVAGYPWFGDWSRDTMTSYEGLFLETGRVTEGRAVLLGAGRSVSEGMLANTADAGGTEYNTVDAAMWFLHAVGRHVERTGDVDLGVELLAAMVQIVEHHLAGTRFGIRVDDDGLVTQGAEGWALTWMDARVDGRPVTPRWGKPVEVNALWVEGLELVAQTAACAGSDPSPFEALAARARASFGRFARHDGLGLPDVIDGPAPAGPGSSGPGSSSMARRPNQLLAVSLSNAPLADPHAVLAAVEPLVTSVGLRSLDPDAAGYRRTHRGGPAERDAAYHEGTVWPWLIGPWTDASIRAGNARADQLAGLEAHLADWGLGSVSETADGDAPHAATGCPFQAWSVAELLRARRRLAALPRGLSGAPSPQRGHRSCELRFAPDSTGST